MWRSYLTVGIRALLKNRTYAVINIFGLALGLAACLIILLYVRYELSYDRWIPDSDRAFQVQSFYSAGPDGNEPMALQVTAYVARKALVKDFPEIENSVFVADADAVVNQDGVPGFAGQFYGVDANFFDIIRMPFSAGDPAHALDRPGDLVLTESEAGRRFPHGQALGKTLNLTAAGRTTDFRVTGIVRDPPRNSHLRFDMIARMDPASVYAGFPQMLTSWGTQFGSVYVKLRPGVSAAAINARLPAWEKRNIPDDPVRGNAGAFQDWRLTNIRDIHLGEAQDAAVSPGNDRSTVLTFALIALLTLGMAMVNFVNLATARASQRAREVALRKAMGARRRQLIVQFLGESVLLAGLSMLLGLAMAELALPHVNSFLGSDMAISYVEADGLLLPIVALTLVVGVAAGLYPAFFLSRFQPASVLKANKSAADAQGSGRLRNLLVVGQFAVSIALIICTAIVHAQTLYARTTDAGYRRDGLLQIENTANSAVIPRLATLADEIARVAGVRHVAPTQIGVTPRNNSNQQYLLAGAARPITLGTYTVDTPFFDAMGMTLLAGRTFDADIARDDSSPPTDGSRDATRAIIARGANAVISESAARRLGFRHVQMAIGKQFAAVLGDGAEQGTAGTMPLTIIGVVRDARFRSIREPLQPIVYLFGRQTNFMQMAVRFDPAEAARVMAGIEHVWRRVVPTVPFTAAFIDERLRAQYRAEEARGTMFGAFALLAVAIGCLGLFGLATFTAERRTREIGVRKVMGARTRDIIRLLTWQFSRPVLVANLIAWPAAWWLMRNWLNGFDARIALSPLYFVVAGAIALVIAIFTIAAHAMKIARANPILALRYE